MKVDLKRELKHLYSASPEPSMADVPGMAFLMINGHGDPNTAPGYAAAVEAVYTVAYTAKFAVRRAAEFDQRLHRFMAEQGRGLSGKHHEIY